jgi:hypothetical protein
LQNQRKRFWLIGALTLLVLSFLVWRIWPTPQPYYNGKPLSYWLKQLPLVQKVYALSGSNSESRAFLELGNSPFAIGSTGTNFYAYSFGYPPFSSPQEVSKALEANRAIRGMGTNALPFLLSKLVRQRSHTWELMGKVATKCGMGRFFVSVFPDPAIGRRQATFALSLVPLPREAVSQLQTLTNNAQANVDLIDCAMWVLKRNADAQ